MEQTKARFGRKPSQKTKNQIKFSKVSRDREQNLWIYIERWTEIIADTIINGFVKPCITEKTTTIKIAAQDESVTEDIASDIETLPNKLMDGIGFWSKSESDLLDN